MEENKRKVFMCLDMKKMSFSSTSNVNTFGLLITLGFSVVYWLVVISLMPLFMLLLDTLSRSTPLTVYTLIYLLILQKLIRVFILKEKQLLADFLESSNNSVTTLGDFYDVRTSGYEACERVNPKTGKQHKFHKVKFRSGAEEYLIKFCRGSITSEYSDTESVQVRIMYRALNRLMSQGILPRVIITDEHVERVNTFKFFQSQLKNADFDEEFVDLCNSTILYHEETAEIYSRITSTVVTVPTVTPKQKIFIHSFLNDVGADLKYSSFRDAILLDKQEILTLYKDLNALNSINEIDLQTEEATSKVPIGESKILYLRNIMTDEIEIFSESATNLRVDVSDLQMDILKKSSIVNNSIPHNDTTSDIEMLDDDEEGILSELNITDEELMEDFKHEQREEERSIEEEVDSFVKLLNSVQDSDCDIVILG